MLFENKIINNVTHWVTILLTKLNISYYITYTITIR